MSCCDARSDEQKVVSDCAVVVHGRHFAPPVLRSRHCFTPRPFSPVVDVGVLGVKETKRSLDDEEYDGREADEGREEENYPHHLQSLRNPPDVVDVPEALDVVAWRFAGAALCDEKDESPEEEEDEY